jgi:hypothetical protein
MQRWVLLIACFIPILTACSSTQEGDDISARSTKEFYKDYAGNDEMAFLFVPDQFVEVRVSINDDDWEALRLQAIRIEDLFSCSTSPPESPYTYFPADITVNGETVKRAGLRTKGLVGSINPSRPSLKIKFDEFVDGQRLEGIRRMTLNNNSQDSSRIRQCLAYHTFARVGLPAPRCSFAKVWVNDQYLGIYSHVEPIKKPFLRRVFGNDSGNLYEGQGADFREGMEERFQRKTNEQINDLTDVRRVVEALKTTDDKLLQALAPIVDLDAFFQFWAMETLISHWDGYTNTTNNFYMYHNPKTDKFEFIPWGTDGSFQTPQLQRNAIGPLRANSTLANRLYLHPEGRGHFIAAVDELHQTVWGTSWVQDVTDRMQQFVEPAIQDDAKARFGNQMAELKEFVRKLPGDCQETLLQGVPPKWEFGPQSFSFDCNEVQAQVSATFSTTFGTMALPNPIGAGNGTMTIEAEEGTQQSDAMSVTAGLDQDMRGGNQIGIRLLFFEANGTITVLIFVTDPSLLKPNTTIEMGPVTTAGFLLRLTLPSTKVESLTFLTGTLSINDFGMNEGDPVSGQFQGEMFDM